MAECVDSVACDGTPAFTQMQVAYTVIPPKPWLNGMQVLGLG